MDTDDEFSLANAIDLAIIMHRDVHFWGQIRFYAGLLC